MGWYQLVASLVFVAARRAPEVPQLSPVRMAGGKAARVVSLVWEGVTVVREALRWLEVLEARAAMPRVSPTGPKTTGSPAAVVAAEVAAEFGVRPVPAALFL